MEKKKEGRRAKRILVRHILPVCSVAPSFLSTEVQLTKQNTGVGGAAADDDTGMPPYGR